MTNNQDSKEQTVQLVDDANQLTQTEWLTAIKADLETLMLAQRGIGTTDEFFGVVYTVQNYADQIDTLAARLVKYAANLRHVGAK